MPTNLDLRKRREHAVPRGVATAAPVFAERALNAEIWDVEGRRYIDFAAGIAVLNVGHRHPRVMAAVHAQLERFSHTAFQVMGYECYVELAERLNALAPFSGRAQTIFFTTGAEAVENAVKVARAATGRPGVITFTDGFHGRTALASAMTGKVAPYKRQFGPPLAGIFHAPFPSDAGGVSVEDTLKAIDHLFAATIDPAQVAAFVIEPVQGEGGFNPAPPELLRALRKRCDEEGILLVADEVQAGFARTGKMFAIEHSGVEPDLVAVAKALAGGFPLSGLIGRADLLDTVMPGGLGGTYGGSPVGCAAALAVLDIIAEEGLLERASVIGHYLRARISEWRLRNDLVPVSEPRGMGAMIGFDVRRHRGQYAPDPESAKAVRERSLGRGLVVLGCGHSGECIRILTPLTASDAIIEEGMDCLEAALSVVR